MKTPVGFLFIMVTAYMYNCRAMNVQVEYYKAATLECDDIRLNISTLSGIRSKYWILPSGMAVDNTTTAPVHKDKSKRWQISDDFGNFNITINKVDDDDFGLYYCVIVYGNYSISTIQQGLNIDGADFSNLMEQYRHNALVGGIAAAVLFGIIALSCIIWNFRYSKKKGKEQQDLNGYKEQSYDNMAAEMEEIKPEFNHGSNNLYPNTSDLSSEKL